MIQPSFLAAARGPQRSAKLWPPIAWLLLLCAGCGTAESDPPDTFPVQGRVVRGEAQPLAGGAIYFRNAAQPTLEAVGEIAADGSFSVYTMFEGQRLDGAVAGDHRVTVVPPSAAGDVPGAIVLQQTYQVNSQPNDITIQLPP